MRFEVGCRLRYQVKAPIAFVFNVAVADSACQEITEEQLRTNPALAVEEVKLVAGSRHMRLHAPASEFALDYRASGTRAPAPTAGLAEVPPAELPLDIVHYVYPSRYCPSDQLLNFAALEYAPVEPGYVRVKAICDWVHANVEYAFGASDAHTAANDTLLSRRGVCRDFAHLAIALCRALNIPARFVRVRPGFAAARFSRLLRSLFGPALVSLRLDEVDPAGLAHKDRYRSGGGRRVFCDDNRFRADDGDERVLSRGSARDRIRRT